MLENFLKKILAVMIMRFSPSISITLGCIVMRSFTELLFISTYEAKENVN